jgi:translation initiation factor 2B subunit (eIF-2B alpha/beta/delta family)
VVAAALSLAAKSGKEFHVYLTRSGEKSQKWLEAANIPVTLIEDMAIGFIMNKVPVIIKPIC